VTIAIRPSMGRDKIGYEVICLRRKQKYFCKRGWTGNLRLICPSGQSQASRSRSTSHSGLLRQKPYLSFVGALSSQAQRLWVDPSFLRGGHPGKGYGQHRGCG
jgi:hypothetical protein